MAKKDAEINRKIKSGINNMSNVNIFAGKYNCGHVFRSPNKKVKIKNVLMRTAGVVLIFLSNNSSNNYKFIKFIFCIQFIILQV